MPKYYQVDSQTYKVVAAAFSPNIMVETNEELDQRKLGTTYDPKTGTFTGYKVTLTANKQYIMADGADTVRVTATIKTWDDQEANDFADPIMFVVDGVPKLVTKKADGYYVDYSTTAAGTKIISVQDDKFIDSASISILVAEVE